MAPAPDPFDYTSAWYPLAPLEDLQPERPTPVQLLGRRYVIWKPPGEGYRVFLDQCPHRLAPLSEGRLDGEGRLMCSYHGWCFDGAGHCRRIPQAAPAEPPPARARHLAATALPVREAVGLLWLWPDPAGAERAAATPLPISPFVEEAAGFRTAAMVRELPYDWQTLVENVADPAHVPFAHHGVQGRREQAVPIPLRMLAETRALLEAEIPSRAFASATKVLFRPPCLLEYRFELPGNRRMGLITYCLPVAPGRSRVVAQFSHTWREPWWRRRPRWFDHATNRNEVLDGDLLILHTIEADLARSCAATATAAGDALAWNRLYRLPTSADRLVIAFQRWLARHGGPWAGASAGAEAACAPPAQLLDRHGQHTVHCRSCRGALATSRRLQVSGLALAALALAAAVLQPDQRRLPVGLPLLLLAAAGGGSALALRHRFDPWFLHRPYDHTRR